MIMKFACLVAATSASAFVTQQLNGAAQRSQGLLANSGNNDDGGQVNIFNMVDDYWSDIWRDKKRNIDVRNLFGGVLPDAKLPSMPNLIDGFLKSQKSSSSPSIESVGDFDVDLANEIEAALAMAENDVVGGGSDYREQQQEPPPPLNRNPMSSSSSKVEAATAAATKAWLDNITAGAADTLNEQQQQLQERYRYEDSNNQSQTPFFANDAEQYENISTGDYVGDSPFHRKSEENWSADNDSSHDVFYAAAQTLADQSIRAGLEKKSVEETYKMYKQYFEQGIETTFDGGAVNSEEAPAPSQQDEVDDYDNKVFISDSAFDLAESLRLDPYEIYQYTQSKYGGSKYMVEDDDVRDYLDWRYEALLSNDKLSKAKQESKKQEYQDNGTRVYQERDRTRANKGEDYGRPSNWQESLKREAPQVDNKIYEERDRERRQRTRANKSADYGRPKFDSESEGNWQSYYDTYKQMAAPPARDLQSFRSSTQQQRDRNQVSPMEASTDPQQYHVQQLSKREQGNYANANYEPQKPRESHLSKLVFETKTEKLNSSQNRGKPSNPESMPYGQTNRVQNSPPNRYDNIQREQNIEPPSRGLGTNKNYPQDRSYRDTKNKNSIGMINNDNDEGMTYEEYNAYFSHSQRPNNRIPPPPMPTPSSSSNSSLKGLLENRLHQNLHKQDLYDQQQQRYFDERLQRDMERVSRLTQVQDRQRELENHIQRNMHRRDLEHQQQELDYRLGKRMERLSRTTQKVTRDAQRAITEKGYKGRQTSY